MKRAISLFLTLVMFVCIMTNIPIMSFAISDFAGGCGTEDDPYLIETKEQLDNVRNNLEAHYKMIENIEFSAEDFSVRGEFYNSSAGWSPIGTDYDSPFTGSFDGNNFKIIGLSITITELAENGQVYAGLFGYGAGCEIKNVILEDTYIHITVDGGSASVGSIIGYSDEFGSGVTITNCSNDGSLYVSASCDLGGIAGGLEKGIIENCYNYSEINLGVGSSGNVGGIIGYLNEGSALNSFNYGQIGMLENTSGNCGGILGVTWGNVISCSNYGNVTSLFDAGGIGASCWGSVEDCCNYGDVTARYCAGGISAVSASTNISVLESGIVNCKNTGKISVGKNSDDMYHITSGGISGHIQNGITISNCYNTGEVVSQSDNGLDCCSGGIVGYNSGGNVEKCNNSGEIIVKTTRYARAGGVVGCNCGGDITNIIEQCFNSGDIYSPVGINGVCAGIAGDNYDRAIIKNCFNIGSVESSGRPGGIVGLTYNSDVSIAQCYNIGVLKTLTSNSYIVGNRNPNLLNCFYLNVLTDAENEISGYACGKGLNLTEITDKNYFTGFNFDTIWTMDGNENYPYPELQAIEMDYEKITENVILLSRPNKTDYLKDTENLELTGAQLLIKYGKGVRDIIYITDDMVTGFNNTIPGKQTLTVTFNGISNVFDVYIHLLTGWIIDKEATCTKVGSKHKECTICGKIIETEEILATDNHISSSWIVDNQGSCTENGLQHKECTVCKEVLETETIYAIGHSYSDWLIDKEATVYSTGSKHKVCTECTETLETETIPQLKCSKAKLSKISNTSSGVKITWGKVSGADSYRVYRKTKGGSWNHIGSTGKTYFTDTTAKSGTTYYYAVKVRNEAGNTDYSNSLSIKRLSNPKLSKVSNTSSGVKVTWKKVTGASGYIVYRKTKSGDWKEIGKTSKLYYTDKKAKSGTSYYYSVRAYSGSVKSYYNTDGLSIRRLVAPKISSATSKNEGVLLKWNKITGASGYYVYRKASSGEWKKIATVKGKTKIKYLDESPRKGATYQYRVKAYYSKSTSYNSNTYKIKCKY